MKKIRLGVLVSGRGSNLQAIIDAIERGQIPAEIAIVISNKSDAYALQRAQKHNIPTVVIDHKAFASRKDFEQALIDELDRHRVDLVCLAGFMRILSPYFVEHYKNRIMNIHPALLPVAKGLYGEHVHKAVLESGAKFSGCTVHFVTEDVDGGPIIIQRVVPVKDDDTVESLAERVLAEEHRAYPEAIRLFAEGKLEIVGRRVKIK
ncbi:MAG: phosphoribosylglycinamide formyltransferase [candidate division WOR-3 bacterium]|nr:phosphoribosylglycinamide formyltransferase [candidate division WOR-3 bacterium]MCX7756857.1 phosphoribosylglycinamide formyltransferase [candidate division WOR-3 bacterium]MDW7987629.1 phosphoribosylglycinamide formyltransferase [candidate division WOR-3 bacterium]